MGMGGGLPPFPVVGGCVGGGLVTTNEGMFFPLCIAMLDGWASVTPPKLSGPIFTPTPAPGNFFWAKAIMDRFTTFSESGFV